MLNRILLTIFAVLIAMGQAPDGLDQETDMIEKNAPLGHQTDMTEPQEIYWKPGTDEYYDNGQLKKCKLDESQDIYGLPAMGWIRFFPDGSIKDAQISEDMEIFEGKVFPAESRIFYTESGLLRHAWMSEDVTFDGYPIKGGGKIDVGFYPDGSLRLIFLDDDTVIQGIPCDESLFFAVKFHDNGQLKSCKLADDVEYRGIDYKKGLSLELDEEGEVISVEKKTIFDL